MNKALMYFSLATLTLTILIMAWVGFYMLYPFKPLSFPNKPIPVLTKEIQAGGQLEYELEYCRYTEKHSHITRQFIDGVIYTTPSVETINPVGCHKMIVALKVPETLDTGIYSLRVLVNTEINKLRTIQNEYTTEQFKIIGRDTLHEQEDEQKFDKLLP